MGEMSKSTEETKKGLECCSNVNFVCNEECPYYKSLSEGEDCCLKKNADALTYIQQLEANDSQVKKALQDNGFQTLEELLQAYSQAKAERDAAVSDIKKSCVACRYYEVTHNGYDCNYKGACDNIYSAWEWRGVPEPKEECNDERR